MHLDLKPSTRRRLRISGLTVLGLAAGALILAWSGLYNVSAARGHWPPVKWLLLFGMQNSVETQAMGIAEPRGYDDAQVILGAGHYHGGCAICHGAPGVTAGATGKQTLPPAPDLASEIPKWRDRELFWIVKNGIKYTGMPGWAAQERDDEVWAIVAFLKRYPSLDAQGYRRLAFGPLQSAPHSGPQLATLGTAAADATGACARCHGAEQSGPVSMRVPTLHGQPREFLVAALEQFANGSRQSGIMHPIAVELTANAIAKLADYYAALKAPGSAIQLDPQSIARGRKLAENGDHVARVPPCGSCHAADAVPAYPRLAGQNAPYMKSRLKLWKQGLAAHTDTAAIMAPIARALTEQQIDDLAAYYASVSSAVTTGEVRP